jgi:hypothetical protein
VNGEPVWLLPSVGRPAAAAQVLEACAEMGMTQQGFLWADGEDYSTVQLPDNWTLIQREQNRGIGRVMNAFYRQHPHASHYGWLADDTIPRTPQFDQLLTTSAGNYGLAYAHDGGYRAIPHNTSILVGHELTAGLVWAGDLLRATGWWALPGLRQGYVDVVWCNLISQLGLARWTPWVLVEHMQWRIGKREKDAWDQMADGNSTPIVAADGVVYEKWKADGMDDTLARLSGLLVAA